MALLEYTVDSYFIGLLLAPYVLFMAGMVSSIHLVLVTHRARTDARLGYIAFPFLMFLGSAVAKYLLS